MKNVVLEALKNANKPMKSAEISTITGLSKVEVDKVLKELKKEEKVFSPKMCFYQVK